LFFSFASHRTDGQLDEEGLKEKRRQKLMKAGIEARARAKREKEREREEREIEERKDQEEREADLSGWVSKRRKEQEVGNQLPGWILAIIRWSRAFMVDVNCRC
jgi:hypothetical protein